MLDPGEAEVIVLGQELGADLLLLDNREPRLFARTVNLNVMGTVGVIMLAADKGFVRQPLQEIHRLRASGFCISDTVLQKLSAGSQKH